MTMPNGFRRSLRRRLTNRRGAALIEAMIGMSVMVLGVVGVAGMTVSAGKRATSVRGAGGRVAIQTQVIDQLMVLPYTDLPSKVGCTSVSTMPYAHSRCTTVADVSTNRRQITVVFTPV